MASISNDAGGFRRILFVAPDGIRKSIRLGKCSKRVAESFKYRVEQLLEKLMFNRPVERELAEWIMGMEPAIASKLIKAGLIPMLDEKPSTALGVFVGSQIEQRSDLKPLTKIARRQVRDDLIEFFGVDHCVKAITPGRADEFKQWLISRGLASSTIHKRLQVTRSFFHAMRRHRLITENPFEGVRVAATGIRDRQRFISLDDSRKVLAACPDAQWRLIFALSRFGGLRCNSEHLALTWGDVDWQSVRIRIRSTKNEHHEGKAERWIPIFPELRPHLQEVFREAEAGTHYVITKYRTANANWRTALTRIVRRAGLTMWPKAFQNLRASRETELVESYPVQVVTDWLGNSPMVAIRHYLMTRDEHFEIAAKTPTQSKAAQKAAQHLLALTRTDSQDTQATHQKTNELLGRASACELMRNEKVAEEGLEPPTRGL